MTKPTLRFITFDELGKLMELLKKSENDLKELREGYQEMYDFEAWERKRIAEELKEEEGTLVGQYKRKVRP